MPNCKSFLRICAFATVPLLLTLSACNRSDNPPTARVTGTVTHNGKPIPNVMVNFMPENGRPSWGQTDGTGHFEMVYDENTKGAELGKKHKVYITPAQPTIDAGASKESRKAVAESTKMDPDELRAVMDKYGTEEKTTYTVEIKKDPEVLEIKLD